MTSDVLGGNAKVTVDESGRPAVSLNIKDTDTCLFDNKNCNIKYIIPSGKYNQILMKVNK